MSNFIGHKNILRLWRGKSVSKKICGQIINIYSDYLENKQMIKKKNGNISIAKKYDESEIVTL